MRPRLDILPDQQRGLWPELAAVPPHFILHGGTAIALRLGHRISIDFDFFASLPLDLDGLVTAIPWVREGVVIQQAPDVFTCVVERLGLPVKLSFFGGIGTGRVGAPEVTADGVLRVASALDLLGHKLKVILQRAEGKVYQDIAALLASGLRLADGLAAAGALFAGFPVMQSVMALGYRADLAEPERVSAQDGRRLDAAVFGLPDAIPTMNRAATTLHAA